MCSMDGCAGKMHGRGLCNTHYNAQLRAERKARKSVAVAVKPQTKPGIESALCVVDGCLEDAFKRERCEYHFEVRKQEISAIRKENGWLGNFYETMDYEDYWLWVKNYLKL